MKYDNEMIAFRIKRIAKLRHIAMKQLLFQAGLNINIVSNLANGKNISALNLAKIADVLQCSMDYLMGRSDNPNI